MRQLNFDLLRLLEGDRRGSHGTRRGRRYVLAQAAETLHRLGYRGLRARGFKGRHIEALVAEWRRQGLSDGTMRNRMAHLRWLARKIGKPGIVRKDQRQLRHRTGGGRARRAARGLAVSAATEARSPVAAAEPSCAA